MFTGIVQAQVQVAYVNHAPKLSHYALAFPKELLKGLQIGASVSVNGTCQTVVAIEANIVSFDAMAETLEKTTLGKLAQHQQVNIERSAKLGDEIGGHVLSGHVMGTATITNIIFPTPEQRVVTFSCSPDWVKYILPKGFIALNGCSLTVVQVKPSGEFTVHLIPETLRASTFGEAKIGDTVNVEIDSQTQLIVETVERVMRERGNDFL